ncbi:MAG TPA: hypothetical protein VGC54_08355 [Planctomycetota bacterium]
MIRLIRLLPLLALFAPGCGESVPDHHDELVGTWVLDADSLGGPDAVAMREGLEFEVDFAADGTVNTIARITTAGRVEQIESTGTWTLLGNQVTVLPVLRDGQPVSRDPRTGTLREGRLTFDDEGQLFTLIRK